MTFTDSTAYYLTPHERKIIDALRTIGQEAEKAAVLSAAALIMRTLEKQK